MCRFFSNFAQQFDAARHIAPQTRLNSYYKAMPETSQYHSKDIMEFVTVGVEYCKRLERAGSTPRREFADAMLKILPLLYIKAQIVLSFSSDDEAYTEHTVTEEGYNAILQGVAATMGEYDDYLDVFMEDMKYSDAPIRCTISESLADIYQEVADFLYVFRQDFDESTYASLCEISESFANRWGQTLVNVLRPLHEFYYSTATDGPDEQEYND